MQNRYRILWLIFSLLVLAAFGARIKAAPVDAGIPDTVSIDSVTAYLNGSGVVPVRFFNDEPLTGIEVTLKKSSADVKLDSVSFASGRLASGAMTGLTRNSDGTFTIYALTFDNIAPGSGLMCRMYFSYAQSIVPQTVKFDTTTFVDGQIWHGTTFNDTSASGSFTPQFVPGYLNIQTSPPTFDSLWVADITAARGQKVAVDVGLYNERNVKNADIALTYGSSRLQFDSVSFAGTRGAQANISGSTDGSTHSLYVGLSFGDGTPLSPGSGRIATLHFTVAPDGSDTAITIDTTTYLSLLTTTLTLTSVDANRQIVPIFHQGQVTIQGSTGVDDGTEQLPTAYQLLQNYPNPFNPTTEIAFSLPMPGEVHLDIYNIMGQRVRELAGGFLPAGYHQITFDGRSDNGQPLASGVYFYRLSAGVFSQTRKMALVK
ncbi:MAG: T9SS type A sorting domain-containing protein [candidate division Zixibacteria bacterium]|nr:T9SS type A sorting domain-containing protein [candidate division Zixibacteria bacterium]